MTRTCAYLYHDNMPHREIDADFYLASTYRWFGNVKVMRATLDNLNKAES